MIIDALANFVAEFYLAVVNLIPPPDFPEWVAGEGDGTFAGAVDWIVSNIGPMAGWVNMPVLYSAVALLTLFATIQHTWNTAMAALRIIKPGVL